MRILIDQVPNPDEAMYDWLKPDLEALGHEVFTFNPGSQFHHLGPSLWQELWRVHLQACQPELVILYPPYDFLNTASCQWARDCGVRLVGFAYDDEIFLPFYEDPAQDADPTLRELAARFDLYLTTSSRTAARMQQAGVPNAHYLPWASSAAGYPLPDPVKRYSVTLIGSAYPRRVELAYFLQSHGIDLQVWGGGWQEHSGLTWGGRVSTAQMRQIYAQSQIVLSPADWSYHAPSPMVKIRTLEIALCGAFQLMEDCADLDSYYVRGQEIETYQTWKELVKKIKFYLADTPAREAIAQASYQRTLREHTWQARWQAVAQLLPPPQQPVIQLSPVDCAIPQITLRYLAEAMLQESLSSPASACLLYEKALEYAPTDYTAHLACGRCYLQLGAWAKAETHLNQALQIGQTLLDRHWQRGVVCYGQMHETDLIHRGLEALPLSVPPLRYLFKLYLARGGKSQVAQLTDGCTDPNLVFHSLRWAVKDFSPEQVVTWELWARVFDYLIHAKLTSSDALELYGQEVEGWRMGLTVCRSPY